MQTLNELLGKHDAERVEIIKRYAAALHERDVAEWEIMHEWRAYWGSFVETRYDNRAIAVSKHLLSTHQRDVSNGVETTNKFLAMRVSGGVPCVYVVTTFEPATGHASYGAASIQTLDGEWFDD
jgi:hypothetical protein